MLHSFAPPSGLPAISHSRGEISRSSGAPLFLAVLLLLPTPALAHASDRGYVLLLPTGYYIVGGALAVAASFVALFLVPAGAFAGLGRWREELGRIRGDRRFAISLVSFLILAVLVAAGFLGSRDPLSNPLPLTVWTLFWIGLTIACGLFGNLFAWIEPWYGPYRLLGRRDEPARGAFLARFGHAPAILQFAGFAWFELVYPAPDDAWRLALAVSVYWAVNFAAMLVFGHSAWTRQGECFSVFFGMISKLSVFERDASGHLRLCLPGGKLYAVRPLPLSGVVFLLLALGSVSFDGFMRTFAWLGHIGVNPLEFPGRSAVMGANTLGLFGMAGALAGAYFLAVWLGWRMAAGKASFGRSAGLLVWSIVPIALAYHVSHYLVALLVNGQYAIAALSDPFSAGWNLFGTADNYISAGLVMGPQAAWVLWNLQAGVIVAGHVLAVLIAHGLAGRLHRGDVQVMLSQLPLTILMVFYTIFGLWLLSTPTGA